MASDITLSSAVRSNLLSLQKTADLLGKTQGRLATGLKVNSALDDPTAFFTSSALNNRASDLNRLQDFVGNAIQTLRAADEGITAITNLVESAEATARQALQTAGGTVSAVQVTGTAAVAADTAPTVTGTSIGSDAELDATGLNFDNTDTIEISLNGTTSIINFENNGNGVAATAASGDNYYINLDDADGATGTAATVTGADVGSPNELEGDLGLDVNDTLTINIDGVTSTINFEKNGNGVDATADSGNNYYINLDDADGSTGAAATVTGAALAGDQTLKTQLGFAAGDALTLTENGTTYTINFEEAGANTNTTGSDGTPPNSFYINLDDYDGAGVGTGETTVSELAATINSISGLNAAFSGGNQFTIGADANNGDVTITVSDASGGGGAADESLFDTLGFTTNSLGSLTVEPASSGNADLSTLAAKINSITNLSSSVASNQLTIASSGFLGDLTITANDNGSASDAVLGALGLTNTGSTGITLVEPASSGDATASTLTSLINSITGLDSSFASNQITIASSSFVGDLSITVKDGGTEDDTKLNALGLTNTGSAGVTLIEPANADLGALTGNLTFQLGTGTVNTVSFGTDDSANEVNTREELLSAINAVSNVTASFVGNALQFDLADTESSLTIGGDAAELTALNLTATTTYASVATTVADRTNFATQFDELRLQIDQLAKDAQYNGVNLLDGDSLTVTFNEDGTSSLGISGVTFDSSGLGVAAAENNFQLDSNITAALTDLESATNTLRSQASAFGSNLSVVETRQDFTKELINVLETGAANLTLADTNEEGANLLALQTRQQLSSTALSLASQADQNVLRLF
ncbi:MAG: flagellin [Methyloligellaceae bacterium]